MHFKKGFLLLQTSAIPAHVLTVEHVRHSAVWGRRHADVKTDLKESCVLKVNV